MSLLDQIAADKEAITAARSALDAATAKLSQDQAALDIVQPHLTALEKIEEFATSIPEQARELFHAAIVEAKGLF